MILSHQEIISHSLVKGFKVDVKSAVGVVFSPQFELLLGKAIADDERNGKWVFPGGGVDGGESPLQAAVREVYEETGISAVPLSMPMIIHPSKPVVSFFVLKCNDVCEFVKNKEFEELRWFSLGNIPQDTLSLNIEILNMIKGVLQ